MTQAAIKSQLSTQIATLSAPYVASTTQDAIALALYNSIQKGVTDGSSAAAGDIGEHIKGTGASSAQTNGIDRNVTSIALTAGDWDVSGVCGLIGAPTGFTLFLVSITPSSATNNGVDGESRLWLPFGSNGNSDVNIAIPPFRVSLSGSATYYLVARANFTGGSCNTYGTLRARRVR